MSASTTDILTAIKNIVTALSTENTNFLNVNGQLNAPTIAVPTVVKNISGRIATVSITTAGSTPGVIYDSAKLSDTTKPIVTIPNIVGVFTAPIPVSFGILVVPGTGQVVTISYS